MLIKGVLKILKYPLNFWVIMFACFINSMAQMIITFISLSLHKHNIDISSIGILVSIFGVGGVVGGFAGGVISDYVSPLKITKISSFVNSILILACIYCHNLWLIGINLFLLGLFNSLFRPASLMVILAFDTIGKPSVVMSYRRVFVNFGVSIGVILNGVLFKYNESFVFIASALFVFVSFISIVFLHIDAFKNNSKQKANNTNTVNKINYKIYYAMFLLTLVLFAYYQQQSIYGIYLNDYLSIDVTKLSWLFAINGILVVLFQIPLTHMLRNVSPYPLSAIGALFIGCGFGLVVFNYGYYIAIISVVMWSFGELLLFPSAFDIMLKIGHNKNGKNMALYQTTFSIGSLAGPALGAFIYGFSPYVTWIVCISIGILSFFGFLSLRSKQL